MVSPLKCRKEQLTTGERTKFWRADDLGDVELLHARYRTHSFGRHTHQGIAVGVIEQGVESFFCKGNTHHAVEGEIIVFNPEQAHTGEAANAEGWTFRMFYFDAELLRTAAMSASKRPVDLPAFGRCIIRDPLLAAQLHRLHEALETSDSSLKRHELFLMTFAELIKRHADSTLEGSGIGLERYAVRKVREYMHANLQQNVALDDLAKLSGLSSYYLIRVFRAEMGLSPHAYLEQVRIHRARVMLKSGLPIASVAAALGFSDQSHLNRHFKKLTGITPGTYRTATTSKTEAL